MASEAITDQRNRHYMMNVTRVYVRPGTLCPLVDSELTSEYGVDLVAEPKDAHWIIAASIKFLVAYSLKYPFKRFLYYTTEPRHSHLIRKKYQAAPLLPKIEIMNSFTGDVFWNNFHFLGSYHFDNGNNLDINLHGALGPISKKSLNLDSRLKTAATFFTYRINDKKSPCIVDGIDRDLEITRCTYALALNQAGLCDVYGRGWPAGISREDSGFQSAHPLRLNWWTRKLVLLAEYRYNLCLENTAANYYCTEKLWHAIQAGTLPIYWSGNTTIYETFPKNSFIDLTDFCGPEQLIECMKTMSEDEYVSRMNICRATFDACIAERRETIANERRAHIEKVVARLRQ